MAPSKKPCRHFQLDRCTRGANCNYAYVYDPTFQRKPCQYFLKGTCRRGDKCKWSHQREDSVTNDASGGSGRAPGNSEALMKDFRWKIPLRTTKPNPLANHALGRFFQQALELVSGETGTMQEAVTLLTKDGGLLRVNQLLDQPFNTFSAPQLTQVINTQLAPFFKLLTHTNVTASILLRPKVVTIYNIMYSGDGSGQRTLSLFTILATHLLNDARLAADILTQGGEVDADVLKVIESSIMVLSDLVEFNTPAHANPSFHPIAESFAALLDKLPDSSAFSTSKARKCFNRLQMRLGMGQSLPDTTRNQRPAGAHATFQYAREMPGELSEGGPRHDNDHADIAKISILPTLQEIQSSRNEYLPVANPQEWHLSGISGLVDRHFRLLREDTVDQLRDAAKFELERLQNPHHHHQTAHKHKRQATNVYNNAYIASAGFDEYHGAQIAIRFARPEANRQQNIRDRQEWWDHSKRLGPDALICLLSSEGSAVFLAVVQQGQKRTQLQTEYDLASDAENAYVVAKPVDTSDLHILLSHEESAYAQLSIVEFPGVHLPSFEPTLKAMQHISREPFDMPFSQILAPDSAPENPGQEIDVQPPIFATKPGFDYDLSCITTGNEAFYFTPGEDLADAATELAQSSSLDLGQARAVCATLARSFAAVQGPPGTGKSFTGTQLIRVLLSNKDATGLGPILVSTQTYHALDGILERCVDDGVSEIVRIRSRSKSERLENINLRVLAKGAEVTKTEKSRRWELHQSINGEVEEISTLLESFASVQSDSAVAYHLQQNYPACHMQIFDDTLDDGFITVKRKRESKVAVWLRKGPYSRGCPRSIHELYDVSLHDMTLAERRLMFNSWISEMEDDLNEKLRHATSSYNDCKSTSTTLGLSGLARNIVLLRGASCKVLMCEEASEILEAHMLTALLPSIEHCVLIGDHQQLRPSAKNYSLSVEGPSGGQYALDVSLFERLVQPQDIFAPRLPLSTLEVQRRMHPSISQLVRQTQHPRLQDDARVSTDPEVVGMRRRLFWWHHEHLKNDKHVGDTTSRTNSFEVDMIAALVRHLAQQGVYKQAYIAVITPYLVEGGHDEL